jgi:hypothetical protein
VDTFWAIGLMRGDFKLQEEILKMGAFESKKFKLLPFELIFAAKEIRTPIPPMAGLTPQIL